MASLQTLELRVAALEARLADVEGGYGATLYRHAVKTDLALARLLDHAGILLVSEKDVDILMERDA
jgi:hypothetical protein